MKIVVANSVGRLDTGQELILFPSRWDSAVTGHRPFAYYPYELGYLSSLLKRETGHDVKMLDGNLDLLDADQYAGRIMEERPDMIVTECSALTYPAMTRCVREVKGETGCDVWLTGPSADVVVGGRRAPCLHLKVTSRARSSMREKIWQLPHGVEAPAGYEIARIIGEVEADHGKVYLVALRKQESVTLSFGEPMTDSEREEFRRYIDQRTIARLKAVKQEQP